MNSPDHTSQPRNRLLDQTTLRPNPTDPACKMAAVVEVPVFYLMAAMKVLLGFLKFFINLVDDFDGPLLEN
ncbi:hypothetical protein HPP92_008403 [Vanilla planifolia]|uniref:Uncharacterized protein n=1 Tax=Vanilla planifolia TaxID=51239 RepID=A0A835R4N0_VANPL|nr:hypothetical protein HPP92_008403 [Vanilla planifolia]